MSGGPGKETQQEVRQLPEGKGSGAKPGTLCTAIAPALDATPGGILASEEPASSTPSLCWHGSRAQPALEHHSLSNAQSEWKGPACGMGPIRDLSAQGFRTEAGGRWRLLPAPGD